jgi:hypothetical protein
MLFVLFVLFMLFLVVFSIFKIRSDFCRLIKEIMNMDSCPS